MSRRDELLAKTANIRSTTDIPDTEVSASAHVPRSGQGSFSRRQAMEERILTLEKFGGEIIGVDKIEPNPWQPRTVFDEEEIGRLAASIAEVGLIQPIVVRRKSAPSGDTSQPNSRASPEGTLFELIAGERRLRAHRVLGLSEIKAVIAEVSDADMALMALAENIEREDLADWEIAKAIQRAESEFPSRTRLADAMGMGRNELYRYLAFLKLPAFVIDALEKEPALISRHSAEAIQATTAKHGSSIEILLQEIWPQVVSGEIEHPRIAGVLELMSARKGHQPRTDRDIKKLFVGNSQAGSIVRDPSLLTIKIKAASLSPESEASLRKFVEGLFENR
ncbi:MAG: ParB/RepB/Spo0J family partition protein [Rhodocyclaceae bacterium]|nr:MAG: ParB/RepB/Spo0J family partition protein [Rhodocyclaceae bacterium]